MGLAPQLVGLQVKGEYERNLLYQRFPVIGGKQSIRRDEAWYLTMLRDAGSFEIGAEVFHLGPRYGGGYDSRRGGVRLYTDLAGETRDQQMLAEYPLVDDNDDDDRYADDNLRDYPNGSEPESGVYPGLDLDNDNVPDDDQNANGVPDFEEPFLLYYSDRQEFVYGIDLNNNGVIDERENDDKPDYPYDRDRRGYHTFLSLPGKPVAELVAGLGYYRLKEIAGGGQATSRYGRISYDIDAPRWGRVELRHDSKRVQDTIPDPVFVFVPGANNNPSRPPRPDALDMADSWVHTSYVGTEVTRVPALTVVNNLQWVLNRRLSEGSRRQTIAVTNKADWRWQRGPVTVQPMFKHLYLRGTRSERRRPLEEWHQIAPILRLDLNFTRRTSLQFGQQGLGGPFTKRLFAPLAFRIVDRVDPERELKSADSVLMLTVRGEYQGYTIVTNTGVQRRHVVYADPAVARTRSGGFSRFFVTIIAGYER